MIFREISLDSITRAIQAWQTLYEETGDPFYRGGLNALRQLIDGKAPLPERPDGHLDS